VTLILGNDFVTEFVRLGIQLFGRRKFLMTPNLETTLRTAEKRYAELLEEYASCLNKQSVSQEALQLTHDVCGLLCSVLDRTARRYWDIHVAPLLSDDDRRKADIYFPIVPSVAGLDSTLGRWRWKNVREHHQPVYDYLLALQPFKMDSNAWMSVIKDLAIKGKHIDLVPQVRTERQRITVTTPGGGSVSWNPSGVRFGSGVWIGGAPVNPATQRIVPTPGLTENIDIWVGFLVADHNVNAAGLCNQACAEVRRIATEMTNMFGLS
jgi:hypothetical protein